MAVLAGSLDLDLGLSADHVETRLGGSLTVDVGLSANHAGGKWLAGTLTVLVDLLPQGLATWSRDDSQAFNVLLEFDADLTTDPAPITPTIGVLTYVRRVSETMPTPSLDSNGRPT